MNWKANRQRRSISGVENFRSGEPQKAPAFVPVDFNPSDLEGRVQRSIEIDLPGGAIVKVPIGATTAEQRQLIAAVVEATSAEVGS